MQEQTKHFKERTFLLKCLLKCKNCIIYHFPLSHCLEVRAQVAQAFLVKFQLSHEEMTTLRGARDVPITEVISMSSKKPELEKVVYSLCRHNLNSNELLMVYSPRMLMIYSLIWTSNFSGFLQSSQTSEAHPRGCENPVADQPADCRVRCTYQLIIYKHVFHGKSVLVKFIAFILNLNGARGGFTVYYVTIRDLTLGL